MPNYNKVIMIGHTTRDIEIKDYSGTKVGKVGIAVNDAYKTKDGKKKETVCFLDCDLFGASAENFAKYVKKGEAVQLEGKLVYSQWKDKETGKTQSKHTLSVNSFVLLGNNGNGKKKQEPDNAEDLDDQGDDYNPFDM